MGTHAAEVFPFRCCRVAGGVAVASILRLKSYEDVQLAENASVLFGNGFSVGVEESFRYESLRKVAQGMKRLDRYDVELFDKFDTSNFERMLQRLREAAAINEVLGIEYTPLLDHYKSIREALLAAVYRVHPDKGSVWPSWMARAAAELQRYSRIFTTSYDLLLYWILAEAKFNGFTDFFRGGDELLFDPRDPPAGISSVFYLHGALFLFARLEDPLEPLTATTYKLRHAVGRPLLDQAQEELEKGNLPIFVSEGEPAQKAASIRSSDYLRFCMDRFSNLGDFLTIYGHSLSYGDRHLVKALVENKNVKGVAYGVHTDGRSADEIADTINEVEQRLRPMLDRIELQFFDATSSPFHYATGAG